MAIQGEPVAHADLVNSSETTLHSHAGGGGGFTPAIFYAQGNSTSNLGTSLGTLTWATPVFEDAGYSESSGTVTIGSALNGKRERIDWNILGTGATNRVEIVVEVQVGGSPVARMHNYSARNATQDAGGMAGYHYLTLTTGMTIRIQAFRIGSTANLVTAGTSFAIETKS